LGVQNVDNVDIYIQNITLICIYIC
jgi:hypothetical protein